VPWRFLDAASLSVRNVSLLPASKNQHKGAVRVDRHLEPCIIPAEIKELVTVVTDAVCIGYQLGKNGRSRFQLNVGPTSVIVGPFGYTTDALGDLVRAALMIATSGLRAEVSLNAEPMEWRLIAERGRQRTRPILLRRIAFWSSG
jgi:hypothetical protein